MMSETDDIDRESVCQPGHYRADTGFEAIDVIEAWELDFATGNAVKYLSRAGRKPGAEAREDRLKALWYIAYKLGGKAIANEVVALVRMEKPAAQPAAATPPNIILAGPTDDQLRASAALAAALVHFAPLATPTDTPTEITPTIEPAAPAVEPGTISSPMSGLLIPIVAEPATPITAPIIVESRSNGAPSSAVVCPETGKDRGEDYVTAAQAAKLLGFTNSTTTTVCLRNAGVKPVNEPRIGVPTIWRRVDVEEVAAKRTITTSQPGAKAILAQSEDFLSSTQAAAELGFQGPSAGASTFLRRLGLSPVGNAVPGAPLLWRREDIEQARAPKPEPAPVPAPVPSPTPIPPTDPKQVAAVRGVLSDWAHGPGQDAANGRVSIVQLAGEEFTAGIIAVLPGLEPQGARLLLVAERAGEYWVDQASRERLLRVQEPGTEHKGFSMPSTLRPGVTIAAHAVRESHHR